MSNTGPKRTHALRPSASPGASVFSFRSSLFPLLSPFFALRTLNLELHPRLPHSRFSIRSSLFAIWHFVRATTWHHVKKKLAKRTHLTVAIDKIKQQFSSSRRDGGVRHLRSPLRSAAPSSRSAGLTLFPPFTLPFRSRLASRICLSNASPCDHLPSRGP